MILGIYGYQDSGKTKLVEQLVGALVKKGYRVSSVKHTPHEKTIDSEGKETWRHGKAGSDPVVFSSRTETSIIKHSETSADEIAKMVLREYDPDVLVFQGFGDGSFPKVAVGKARPRKGTVLANPRLPRLVKHIETEVALEKVLKVLPGLDCGKCGLDCRGLAGKVVKGKKQIGDCKEFSDLEVAILVGGKKIPAGKFVSSVVNETIRGMLGTLRGVEPGKEVEVRLGAKKGGAKRRSRGS
jgi:molybdopterin-guanine dinucleotide biosynthesis protein B